jgi:hypothetical protein
VLYLVIAILLVFAIAGAVTISPLALVLLLFAVYLLVRGRHGVV